MADDLRHGNNDWKRDDAADNEADEEIDPELLGLASSHRRPSILRPVLFIVVIWLGVSIIDDWQTELAYFVSSSEPADIGTVTEFASERAKDPDWTPEIPHNRYVSVDGVPSRRSQSKKYRFFKLVGGHVYVEKRRADADKTDLERQRDGERKGPVDRTYFEGSGRAVHLSAVPDTYGGLRRYYYQRYGTLFCGMELPEKQRRAAKKAGRQCVDAYVIEAGVTPVDHWWYAALSAIIGLFVLLNIWWLIRWVRDVVRN